MTPPAQAAAAVAAGYLLGSVPFGYLFGRMTVGVDVRREGSGNVGATNVFRVVGPAAGLATGVLDLAKGWAAVALVDALARDAAPWIRLAAGMAAVAGHNWSAWLGFRGGRGVLTTAGVFLSLAWLPLVGAAAVFAAVFGATRYVSVGSMAAAASLPVLMGLIPGRWRDPVLLGVAALAALLVIVRHVPNIRRLAAGTEHRAGRPRRP